MTDGDAEVESFLAKAGLTDNLDVAWFLAKASLTFDEADMRECGSGRVLVNVAQPPYPPSPTPNRRATAVSNPNSSC